MTTAYYSSNFRQHLIDHGIYHDGHEYLDGRVLALPDNWGDINKRLLVMQRRPSLSPSRFTNDDFRKSNRADTHASNEHPVIIEVVPRIEGDDFGDQCRGGGYRFANLAPLTDGSLAPATPDRFYGARPEHLDRQIREELSNLIILSRRDDRPIAPIFFLEAKGPDGSAAVARRQAWYYDSALGARAIHALQSYQQERPIYDNNSYTITSTYADGTLKLYTTHRIEPKGPDCRPEYIMTQLRSWAMTDTPETFRQGASAYRNARDWAKEKRDEFIRLANERHLNAQAPHSENRRSSQ